MSLRRTKDSLILDVCDLLAAMAALSQVLEICFQLECPGIRIRLRRFFLGFKVRGESKGASNPLIPKLCFIFCSHYQFFFVILYFIS